MLSALELLMIDKAANDLVRNAQDVPAHLRETPVRVTVALPHRRRPGGREFREEVAQTFNQYLAALGWSCPLTGDDILRLGRST